MPEIEFLEPSKTFNIIFKNELYFFIIFSSISVIVGLFINLEPILWAILFGFATILIYNFLLYISYVSNFKSKNFSFFKGFLSSLIRVVITGFAIFGTIAFIALYNGDWAINFSDTYNFLNFYLYIILISIPMISAFYTSLSKKVNT